MNAKLAEDVANAVLYEGYILYPYRRSSVKNRQRFNFGVLTPLEYCEAHPAGENSHFQVECLAREGASSALRIKVRFLRLVERTVAQISPALAQLPDRGLPPYQPVQSFTINGRTYEPWQEAAESSIEVECSAANLLANPRVQPFELPVVQDCQELRDPAGQIAGLVIRKQESLKGTITISAHSVQTGILKFTVRVSNLTPANLPQDCPREDVLKFSLLSAHAILQIPGGEFISLQDPPEDCRDAASTCRNSTVWPVLIGEENSHDAMLASPIILYDYPQIAPESPGELFDGTEIDEILALRILTLTDEEKQEMSRGDERARQILERTESLPPEHMMKLHGVLRGIRPANGEAK